MKFSEKLFGLLLVGEWIAWGNKSLDPEERQAGWELAKRTAQRVAMAMLAVAGLSAGGMYGWLVISSQATGATPVGIEATTEQIVVPQQPGPDFNTLAWCQDPATTKDVALAARPEGEPRIILVRGIERINWAGLPTTYQAEWKSTLADGSEQTATVPMPKAAQECFQRKSK